VSILSTPAPDACTSDPALAQHLNELVAELRDRGIAPRPLNVLHFALETGLSETEAANLVALFERRLAWGEMANPELPMHPLQSNAY